MPVQTPGNVVDVRDFVISMLPHIPVEVIDLYFSEQDRILNNSDNSIVRVFSVDQIEGIERNLAIEIFDAETNVLEMNGLLDNFVNIIN